MAMTAREFRNTVVYCLDRSLPNFTGQGLSVEMDEVVEGAVSKPSIIARIGADVFQITVSRVEPHESPTESATRLDEEGCPLTPPPGEES